MKFPVPSQIPLERLAESLESFFDRTAPVAGLSNRQRATRNRHVHVFLNAGIVRVWQLVSLAEADVLMIRDAGPGALEFAKEQLEKERISLHMFPAFRAMREEIPYGSGVWSYLVARLGESPTVRSKEIPWNPDWPREGIALEELFVYAPSKEASRYAKMVAFCQRKKLEDVFPKETHVELMGELEDSGVETLLEFLACFVAFGNSPLPHLISEACTTLLEAMRKEGITFG